jgi:hypothetical protein
VQARRTSIAVLRWAISLLTVITFVNCEHPRRAKAISWSSFEKSLDERRKALDFSEQKRVEIVNSLEFKPVGLNFGFCLPPVLTPANAIDPHRSLFVHDDATLTAADFSLWRTLSQLATQVSATVSGTTAVTIFRQFWDTQRVAQPGDTEPRCDDNAGTINGFPIQCPRHEKSEATGTDYGLQARIHLYKVLALVNRLDLAHKGWRNCGEYRIVYGRQDVASSKNLIIFEAVLPNPRPGCREGCLPIAEFWKSLSAIDAAAVRAQKLENFFYNGLPGFRPVVHVDHYSATGVTASYGSSGSGQIRTNQFLERPWMLKEFKTVIDCSASPCKFHLVPIMVKVNPFGPLWNEDDARTLGAAFRADTVAQLGRLSSSDLMAIGYDVQPQFDAGQSQSQKIVAPILDHYMEQMNLATVSTNFRRALAGGSLSAEQVANRALAVSCAGCHSPTTFALDRAGSIGTVNAPAGSSSPTIDHWPAVVGAGFVHVDVPVIPRPELVANPAAFGNGNGHEISPALLEFFLPERKNFLLGQLNAPRCTCVNRFLFLPDPLRKKALRIQESVQLEFAERLTAINGEPPAECDLVLLERDSALKNRLREANITLRDEEILDLEPRTMKLQTHDIVREVNSLLTKEPARRTVTGSFRVH